MIVEHVVGEIVRGAFGIRRKRHRGALDYLVGGPSSLLNSGTLFGALGVAWGVFETMQASRVPASSPMPAAPGGSHQPPSVAPASQTETPADSSSGSGIESVASEQVTTGLTSDTSEQPASMSVPP